MLIVLALLQYRWSSEVSEATRTRMQASLQMSLMHFREDLSRELAAMCLELQAETGSVSADARTLTAKLEHWRRTTTDPGLVANVYLWDPATGDSSLLRLSVSETRFEAVPWPAKFDRLRQTLAEFSRENGRRPLVTPADRARRSANSSAQTGAPIPAAIDQSIPALVLPATHSDTALSSGNGFGSSWLLIELDSNDLRYRVFPDLADRYFGDSGSSEYAVAVVDGSGDERQVLYSSDAGFGSDKNLSADGNLNLFGPPVSRTTPQSATAPFRPAPALLAAGGASNPAQQHDLFGPIPYNPVHFDPIHDSAESTDWEIVARSRKGSVEAVVAGLRRRDLALSFGVLLVLAATTGLIIFTAQRAQRLAKLQMEFVAGVSHELRTPVAAILSAAENIADGVVGNKQQLAQYGTIIKNQARQLNHLVDQVLRFSAAQKTKAGSPAKAISVVQVIDGALENTASVISDAGFRVEVEVEPNLPAVNADSETLSQCLQNLVTNAVKYGGLEQWLGIQATSEPTANGGEIAITVEDHGIGIQPEDMQQIFEPFYRSPAVASQVHGTGLGLALAKSFAEALGGRLTVKSEVGKGSAFTIHLPVAGEVRQDQNATRTLQSTPGVRAESRG